jgi:hypothetical protein
MRGESEPEEKEMSESKNVYVVAFRDTRGMRTSFFGMFGISEETFPSLEAAKEAAEKALAGTLGSVKTEKLPAGMHLFSVNGAPVALTTVLIPEKKNYDALVEVDIEYTWGAGETHVFYAAYPQGDGVVWKNIGGWERGIGPNTPDIVKTESRDIGELFDAVVLYCHADDSPIWGTAQESSLEEAVKLIEEAYEFARPWTTDVIWKAGGKCSENE